MAFPIAAVGALEGGVALSQSSCVTWAPSRASHSWSFMGLDPTQESKLAELLSHSGSMPVHVARAGSRVEQNHVYVVPSGGALVLRDGVLQGTTPGEEAPGAPLPIDRFFASLAADQRAHAIGVLLSGSVSLHLIVVPNADQYAAEMDAQLV
jgi:two-component system CheB/CheR fusion protein